MIKLRLECWWTDSNSLHERMLRQFVPTEDLNKYVFTNDTADFTIVFGRTEWDKIKTPKERTFYFSQEPLWSPNQPKDGIHEYCSKIFVSDKREYPDREEYIESLLPMFYAGRGESDYREDWDWSYKIKDKTYNKNKLISLIVRKEGSLHSYHNTNSETNTAIYNTRTELGIKLSYNHLIDIYGTNWVSNDKNIKGEVWNKHVGLDEYKFSIACENTIQKNYISEKFWDVVLTNGIPIYLGCSNIKEYINEDCFIYLNDLTDEERVLKINDIINNEDKYHKLMYKNILNLKQEFFKSPKFNLWEKIKEITK